MHMTIMYKMTRNTSALCSGKKETVVVRLPALQAPEVPVEEAVFLN